jgi:hypothetical protein
VIALPSQADNLTQRAGTMADTLRKREMFRIKMP